MPNKWVNLNHNPPSQYRRNHKTCLRKGRISKALIPSIRLFQQRLCAQRKALDDGIFVNLNHDAAFALEAHLFNIP
ncbi:hypothetical protein PAJ34TS1_10820 [Paenibacillus azoreducens]